MPGRTVTLTSEEVISIVTDLVSITDALEQVGEHHLGFAAEQIANLLVDRLFGVEGDE